MQPQDAETHRQDATNVGSLISTSRALATDVESNGETVVGVNSSGTLASMFSTPGGTVEVRDGQFNAIGGHQISIMIHTGLEGVRPIGTGSGTINEALPALRVEETRASEIGRFEADYETLTTDPQALPPALPVHRSCDIYYRYMVAEGRGSPLWIPEPNKNLPIQYQRQGIAIGDVGIITASGSFDFLFNISLPLGHPINPAELPENFLPFSIPPIDIRRQLEFKNDSYLASASIEKSHRDGDSSGLTFESSASEGSILTMPRGSQSEDLGNVVRLRRYVAANMVNWYKYIHDVRGREVRNGDVRLVIGLDKTTTWGMATFSNATTKKDSFRLKFRPMEEDGSLGRSYGWEYSGRAQVRSGPDPQEIETLRMDDPSQEGLEYENQSLFLRTMNTTLSDDVWNQLAFETGVFEGIHTGDNRPPSVPFSNQRVSSGGMVSSNSDPSIFSSGSHAGISASALPVNDNVVTVYAATSVYLSAPSLITHPSKAINELILNSSNIDVRMVITEDKDWMSVLSKNVLVPPVGELCTRIMASSVIREEEGVLFLEKTIEGFQADQESIDADRQKIDDLREELNGPAAKAISERYDAVKFDHMDELKESDQVNGDPSRLFEERDNIQIQLERELHQQHREANDQYWTKLNEDRGRADKARAQRGAVENKKEDAQRYLEEAQMQPSPYHHGPGNRATMAADSEKPSVLIFGGLNTCSRALAVFLAPLDGDSKVSHLRIVDKYSVHPATTYIGPEFTKVLENHQIEYRQANLTVAAAIQSAFEPPAGKPGFDYVFDFTGEVRNEQSELIQIITTFSIARLLGLEAAKRKVKAYIRIQQPFYKTSAKTALETDDVKPADTMGIWWHESLRMLASIKDLNLVVLRIGFVYGPYTIFGNSKWSPGKNPSNSIHIEDVAGGAWACANWMAGHGRKAADNLAGVPIPFHNDKGKVKEVEGMLPHDQNPVAPLFNLVDDSNSTLVSTGKTISSFFGTAFEFFNQVESTVRLLDDLEDINEHRVEGWTEMLQNSNPPIVNTPVSPHMDKYTLEKHIVGYDNSKIKQVVGYKLLRPEFNHANIKEIIDKWKEEGVWPNAPSPSVQIDK